MHVYASRKRSSFGRRVRLAVFARADGRLHPGLCISWLADSHNPRRPHEGDEQEMHVLLKRRLRCFGRDVRRRAPQGAAFIPAVVKKRIYSYNLTIVKLYE